MTERWRPQIPAKLQESVGASSILPNILADNSLPIAIQHSVMTSQNSKFSLGETVTASGMTDSVQFSQKRPTNSLKLFFTSFIDSGKIIFSNLSLQLILLKDFILNQTTKQIMPRYRGFLLSTVFGAKSATVAPEINKWFTDLGIQHLLAASGYNVNIVVTVVRRSFRRSPRLLVWLAAIGSCWGYCWLADFTPALIRAGTMATLSLSAKMIWGRQVSPGWVLILTFLCWSLINPDLSTNLSWQLSVAATAGIIFLALPDIFISRDGRWPVLSQGQQLWSELKVGISATWGVAPILIWNFQTLQIQGVLATVLIAPIFPILMFFTTITMIVGWLFPGGMFVWQSLLAPYLEVLFGVLNQMSHILSSWSITFSPRLASLSALIIFCSQLCYLVWQWRRKKTVGFGRRSLLARLSVVD